MPFDPRLIHPDEPPLDEAGEIALPGDLAALGEQLSDDAAHLAALYPSRSGLPSRTWQFELTSAGQSAPARQAGLTRVRRSTTIAAAIALSVSLAALLAAVVVMRMPAGPMTVAGGGDAAAQPAVIPAEPPATHAYHSLPSGPPAVSLAELSSPEWEAVFDLWQQDPGGHSSVSF